MEIISLIISIISISISAIVTGIPFYYKYIEKKTKITLTACDGIIRNDILHIIITYVNRNWQNAVITDSKITLCKPESAISYTKMLYNWNYISFKPIVLQEKQHASIEITYPLSDLGTEDLTDFSILINTEYVDSKGRRLCDNHTIGGFCKSAINTWMASVESVAHRLNGKIIMASMKL